MIIFELKNHAYPHKNDLRTAEEGHLHVAEDECFLQLVERNEVVQVEIFQQSLDEEQTRDHHPVLHPVDLQK